jgi:hypothetical protein
MSDPTDRPDLTAPIDGDWLRELGATSNHGIEWLYDFQMQERDGWEIFLRLDESEDWEVSLMQSPVGGYEARGLVIATAKLRTRGDFRLLCRALGVALNDASPAPSGGQADQPAEPSERELPTHAGLWIHPTGWADIGHRTAVRDGVPRRDGALSAEAWCFGGRHSLGWFDLDDPDFPRGHWRPAVPDTALRAERDRLREQRMRKWVESKLKPT